MSLSIGSQLNCEFTRSPFILQSNKYHFEDIYVFLYFSKSRKVYACDGFEVELEVLISQVRLNQCKISRLIF